MKLVLKSRKKNRRREEKEGEKRVAWGMDMCVIFTVRFDLTWEGFFRFRHVGIRERKKDEMR